MNPICDPDIEAEKEFLKRFNEEIMPGLKIDPFRDEKLTPMSKIKPSSISITLPNICLMLYGSFYPLHLNHIRTLEKAKEEMERRGNNIIGCFIVPTPQANLKRKYGSKVLKKDIRERMYIEAVKGIDWVSVDFFALLSATNKGAVYAKNRLQTLLNKKFCPKSGKICEWKIDRNNKIV
jgi:hypothetical protein